MGCICRCSCKHSYPVNGYFVTYLKLNNRRRLRRLYRLHSVITLIYLSLDLIRPVGDLVEECRDIFRAQTHAVHARPADTDLDGTECGQFGCPVDQRLVA